MQSAGAQGTSAAATATVLSGGVGIESGEEIKPRQNEFNLKFVFTLMEGDYVADVSVKITDNSGRVVLEHLADGPLLLARLPAGNYVATLTYDGVTQTRKVSLRAKGLQTVQARWKRSAADGPPML